jgi:hypothetical protein
MLLYGWNSILMSWPAIPGVILGPEIHRLWLPLAIGSMVLTGLLFVLALRWPKPINFEKKAQGLLEQALQWEGEGNLRQAAWLIRQACEEDPENAGLTARLYDLFWRIGLQAAENGDSAEVQLYLRLIPPEHPLFSEAQEQLDRLAPARGAAPATSGLSSEGLPEEEDRVNPGGAKVG